MAKCACCGKGVAFGIKVSHSHRRANRTWKPNVKRVKAVVDLSLIHILGGSEEAFAEMMNQKAAELGMTHTHFVNACGLDAEGHYSSARDVARMSAELLHHPKILEY